MTQTLQIAPGLIWRVLDDNAVVVSPNGGKVRVLNGVGTIIWQLVAEQKNIGEILDYLITHYQVPPEQAREDLNSFLSELQERGLVVIGNEK